MGVLSDLMASFNAHTQRKREKKVTLARYLCWRAVPQELQLSIRRFCIFLWEVNDGNDVYEDDLKDQLPPKLRSELCNHLYGPLLGSAPCFAWLADYPACAKHLASRIENVFLEKGDYIFRVDERNEAVHLLLSGRVTCTRNEPIET